MNQEPKQEKRVPQLVVTGPPAQGLSFSIPAWLRLQATATGTTGVSIALPPQHGPEASPVEKTPMVVDTSRYQSPVEYPEPTFEEVLHQEWPGGFDIKRMAKEHRKWKLDVQDFQLFGQTIGDSTTSRPHEVNFIYQGCLVYVYVDGLVELRGPKRDELAAACRGLFETLAKYATPAQDC